LKLLEWLFAKLLIAYLEQYDLLLKLRRLWESFGITFVVSVVFDWLHPTHAIWSTTVISRGIPQLSVVGPILFLLYTADFQAVIELYGMRPHFYADDVQISGQAKPLAVAKLHFQLLACIDGWLLAMRPPSTEYRATYYMRSGWAIATHSSESLTHFWQFSHTVHTRNMWRRDKVVTTELNWEMICHPQLSH
jgi:hypothetical protein